MPVRKAFPWGNKQGVPCGKAPPGGTEGCARAGSIPQGEQARCTVWKDPHWGNKQGVPCGKAPLRGTGWCACMGSIPLGEQARRTVWRKFPWGNKPRYTCAVSAPLGEQKRFPWGSGQGARSGRSQEKIKKKSRKNQEIISALTAVHSHLLGPPIYVAQIRQPLMLHSSSSNLNLHRLSFKLKSTSPLPPCPPLPSPPSR